MTSKPVVVIYRDHLLPSSETFVRNQAESLRGYIPYYVGSRIVPGLALPHDRSWAVNRGGLVGRMSEICYKVMHLSPQLSKRVRELRPALIHAHFGPDGALAMPLARRLGVPIVISFHGYDVTVKDEYARRSFYTHRMYLRRRSELKRGASLFIAVSRFIKKRLLEQGFPSDRIVVHYIGIDTERFRPDHDVQREPFVLFVGRMVEKKGCELLVKAMRIVQAKRPDVELVLVGDGPLRPRLESLARAALKRYRFVGAQPAESVRAWMNRAKVFCGPSVTASSGDSEGFGLVFAEAQAMKLPVVSFRSGGIPEAVGHEETGLLAEEGDWETLSRHIIVLLEDLELWQRFSEAGRKRVSSRFDLNKQTRVMEELYERVIDNRDVTR